MSDKVLIERELLESLADQNPVVRICATEELRRELRRELANLQTSAAQSAPVIDLDANAWESIKQAANESPWIPPQYFMSDWVADVCEFLRADRAAQSAPDEREAQRAALDKEFAPLSYSADQRDIDLRNRVERPCFARGFTAGAAWQRAQSAPVVPEGWRVSVVDYGNRTGEASISGPGVYCMQVPVSYSMLDFMQALAASYRRNQSEPAAHEGWRLVPVEPTEEMIDAGRREHTCVQGDSWYSDSEISEHDAIAVFKAMLAAASKVAPHG